MQQAKQYLVRQGRSSADATRARILLSAQKAFSSRGYNDVGLREIAAAAGCDTTLIRRYFGSKELLFEKALSETLDVSVLLDGPRKNFGERAVAFFASDSRAEIQPVQMLIFATSDTVSRAIALRLMEEQVVKPIANWLDCSNGRSLAVRISMLCSGYFLYGRVLPLEADIGSTLPTTEHWLARQLQEAVDSAG